MQHPDDACAQPAATLALAFGVGATLGALVPFGRLIVHAIHYAREVT